MRYKSEEKQQLEKLVPVTLKPQRGVTPELSRGDVASAVLRVQQKPAPLAKVLNVGSTEVG